MGNLAAVNKTDFLVNCFKHQALLRKFVLLLKLWSKRRNISNSCAKGLNNFVYTLLAINFFQRQGAVPVFKSQEFSVEKVERMKRAMFDFTVEIQQKSSEKTVVELLCSFFKELSEFDYKAQCVSCRLGKFIPKIVLLLLQPLQRIFLSKILVFLLKTQAEQ